MNALAFIQASVDEQIERERHGPNHICHRCRAARAIALAQSGKEPSIFELDPTDPATAKFLVEGMAAVREVRDRIDRVAAEYYALESLRGRRVRRRSS